jgi:hypothetical protein
MSIIPALRRHRQEFRTSLDYVARTCLQRKKRRKKSLNLAYLSYKWHMTFDTLITKFFTL